jgi:hypothetical protein
MMANNWYFGNAHTDGRTTAIGSFGHVLGDEDGVRASRDVEVKWASIPPGRTGGSG